MNLFVIYTMDFLYRILVPEGIELEDLLLLKIGDLLFADGDLMVSVKNRQVRVPLKGKIVLERFIKIAMKQPKSEYLFVNNVALI